MVFRCILKIHRNRAHKNKLLDIGFFALPYKESSSLCIDSEILLRFRFSGYGCEMDNNITGSKRMSIFVIVENTSLYSTNIFGSGEMRKIQCGFSAEAVDCSETVAVQFSKEVSAYKTAGTSDK